MRFGESDVNVTALGTLLWVLGMAQRGSKAAQPFPFARAHTDLRRSRHQHRRLIGDHDV
jgi:hypothetical protein